VRRIAGTHVTPVPRSKAPAMDQPRKILLIGASRGLGLGMAAAFLARGWHVVGTVRGPGTKLHDLAAGAAGRHAIETLDINEPDQLAALRQTLDGQIFDILFVNAGISNNPAETIGDVSTAEFTRVMVTNALSPMRAVETLTTLVSPTGTIGVMSPGQGSVANNTTGMREVYRASKAALNQLMRSFAARHAASQHPMTVMAPGWVRTELGGPEGRLSIEESIPSLVSVLIALEGKPALHYLDYLGRTVPW
jgi:NAD(P)-dependent dehydrogenase (short-subunit alcohol dehydrogenase family)